MSLKPTYRFTIVSFMGERFSCVVMMWCFVKFTVFAWICWFLENYVDLCIINLLRFDDQVEFVLIIMAFYFYVFNGLLVCSENETKATPWILFEMRMVYLYVTLYI